MNLKKEYKIFVDEMVKNGDQVKAYQKAYPKAAIGTARVESYRILQNPTVQQAIKEKSDKIESIATEKAAEELKDVIIGNTLTRQRKLEILKEIAEGSMEIPVKKPVWDRKEEKYVFVPMMEKPDHSARMKAIEIDNKMTGDNAPEQIKHSGMITTTLNEDQFKLMVELLK